MAAKRDQYGDVDPKFAHCAQNLGTHSQRRGREYRYRRCLTLTDTEMRVLREIGHGSASAGVATLIERERAKQKGQLATAVQRMSEFD